MYYLCSVIIKQIKKMKYSELEKRLKKEGCSFYKNGGKHPVWISKITGKKFAMSYHRSEEVALGTLKNIIELSGVKL
jgi:predicted RNA binding protein YcfA (HicA-like mRNA interferase family)